MGEFNIKKIIFGILFLCAATVSCWATTESLRLIMPDYNQIFLWIIVIIFYIVASLGFDWAINSFNQDIYQEHRTLRFIGGAVLFLLAWLVCSMPTNTHTFFFIDQVRSTVNNDLSETMGYSAQIMQNKIVEEKIQAAQNKLRNDIEMKLGELEAEIRNELNPGFGPKSEQILRDFASLLSVAKVEPLTYKSAVNKDKIVDEYRSKIMQLMDSRMDVIDNSLRAADENTYVALAAGDYKNLYELQEQINNKQLDIKKPLGVQKVSDALDQAYGTIKTYKDHVAFNSELSEKRYTDEHPTTLVKRLLSVFDVWRDFLKGEYENNTLRISFWVVISVILDICAFIFFHIAFKKEDY